MKPCWAKRSRISCSEMPFSTCWSTWPRSSAILTRNSAMKILEQGKPYSSHKSSIQRVLCALPQRMGGFSIIAHFGHLNLLILHLSKVLCPATIELPSCLPEFPPLAAEQNERGCPELEHSLRAERSGNR